MRRCLHSLLIGVLTFMISVDAVRACGHRRRRCAPVACADPWLAPGRAAARDGWATCVPAGCGSVVVVDWACGCGAVACAPGGTDVAAAWEPIGCGIPLECCGSTAAPLAVAPVEGPSAQVPPPAPQRESEVVAAPAPAAESTPVAEPTPAVPADAPSPVASAVPDLEPVEPASASVPVVPPPPEAAPADVAMPVVAPEPPEPEMAAPAVAPAESESESAPPAGDAVAPAPEPAPEPPPRRNAFQDADDEGAPADESPREPLDAPEAVPDAAAPGESPRDDAVPVDEAPAVEPMPAAEPEAAAEPTRRWIDDTASYAVVGQLVDVRGEVVEILTAAGRRVHVPLVRLSRFDRDYVDAAGPRVAARRPGPRASDTASR